MASGTSDRRNTVLVPRATRVARIDRIAEQWECDDDVGTPPQHLPGVWHVWIAANKDFTLGTYLELHDDGRVNRVTLREGEGDDIMVIKPADE